MNPSGPHDQRVRIGGRGHFSVPLRTAIDAEGIRRVLGPVRRAGLAVEYEVGRDVNQPGIDRLRRLGEPADRSGIDQLRRLGLFFGSVHCRVRDRIENDPRLRLRDRGL